MQLGRDNVVIGEVLRLTVKLEARHSSGTLVSIWQPTRHHTAENGNLCSDVRNSDHNVSICSCDVGNEISAINTQYPGVTRGHFLDPIA